MLQGKARRGSTIIEFGLAGIVLIFVWISIVQMAIGMWRYSTLQYATKLAGSFSAVRGAGCYLPGSDCAIQIKHAAHIIQVNAPGLDSALTNVVFSAVSPSDHSTVLASHSCRLDSCLTDITAWPLSSHNARGQELRIDVDYLYNSGIVMWAPGAGGTVFGSVHLPGHTQQVVMY